MKKMKLVCVGNGMAGVRTIEELLAHLAGSLRHHDLRRRAASELQPHPAFAGARGRADARRDRAEQRREWYAKHGITLHAGKKIVAIDRTRRVVVADDGTEAPYDRLLLATGSNPVMLPIPGGKLEGVLTYRDIADTEAMIEAATHYKHAVVIGGGLLGLEAANGLRARGMDVTVVHLLDSLMERQLDKTAAKLLQSSLEARGLKFLLPKQTSRNRRRRIGPRVRRALCRRRNIPADLVVMAVGVRPNTELAEKAGLHCSRGIVVSDTMQTFDPRIYAVGECVNHRGVAYGLVAPLFEMAKVCANHLALLGIGRYLGSITSTKLKVTGIDLFSAGDFVGGEGTEHITLSDPMAGVYKKLVVKDEKLVGAVLYGDTVDGAYYFKLLREGRSVADLRDRLMFGEANLGDTGHLGQKPRGRDVRRHGSLRLQRRVQRHDRERRSRSKASSRSTTCASTPRRRARAARAPVSSSSS